ncbi:MAG: AraC family transcriptional regulator [Lentisphaeria bacterium]
MIDIEKVRKWSVHFARTQGVTALPYPNMVVEEVEGVGYRIPQCQAENIPPEIGGQITLTLAGEGRLQVQGKEYKLIPGTAFLYRDCDPAVAYYSPPKMSEPWCFVWINFMSASAEKLIAEINRNYGYFFDLRQDDALKIKLLEFRKFSGATLFQTPLEGAKLMFDLLNLLCRNTEQNLMMQNQNRLVREVQNEINKSYDERISSSLLAKKLGVSRERLSKLFHEKTGQTFVDYRREQRLNKALNLLLKSNLSCKEIARHCNFGSYSSFFRAFVKEFHQTPEIFRQKLVSRQ